MANVRVETNRQAIRDLLRSNETEQLLLKGARRIKDAAGPGHEADSSKGSNRARATVWTATAQARLASAREHRLLRAIDAGRG